LNRPLVSFSRWGRGSGGIGGEPKACLGGGKPAHRKLQATSAHKWIHVCSFGVCVVWAIARGILSFGDASSAPERRVRQDLAPLPRGGTYLKRSPVAGCRSRRGCGLLVGHAPSASRGRQRNRGRAHRGADTAVGRLMTAARPSALRTRPESAPA